MYSVYICCEATHLVRLHPNFIIRMKNLRFQTFEWDVRRWKPYGSACVNSKFNFSMFEHNYKHMHELYLTVSFDHCHYYVRNVIWVFLELVPHIWISHRNTKQHKIQQQQSQRLSFESNAYYICCFLLVLFHNHILQNTINQNVEKNLFTFPFGNFTYCFTSSILVIVFNL